MLPKHTARGAVALAIGLIATLAIFQPVAQAQTQAFSASLTGVVHDSSEAAVPGAKVTLASPEKGVTRTFTTDADGRYSFALLPPATYILTVEVTGFSSFKQAGIVLEAGQSSSQEVTLQVGAIHSEVTVSAEGGAILTSDNANVSSDLNEQQIDQLPVDFRSAFGLVLTNSSVNNASQFQVVNGGGQSGTADQDISFLNFGGGYFGTSAYLLDGHWDTAGDWGGAIYVPSMESVEEARIQTNSFTAEYGWSTGNVYNVITKSGTSSLHGDAFEFLRNSDLDANFFFNNAQGIPRTAFKRNQFGVAGGGPVYIPGLYKQRNKTFFFAYYEGLRQGTPGPVTLTMPTAAEKAGDFSGISQVIYNPFSTVATSTGFTRTPFAGNKIPANLISKVGAKLVGYYPAPTNSALLNNFSASASAAATSDEYGIRIDHNFSDSVRFFGRWSRKLESKVEEADYYGNDPGGPGSMNPNNRLDGAAGLTWVLSPTTILSFNGGYNHWFEGNVMEGYPFDFTQLGLPAFINATSNQFPVVSVGGYAGLGPQNGAGQGGFPRNDLTWSADLSKVHGSHSFSMGFMEVVSQTGGGRIYPTTFNFGQVSTAGPDPLTADPNTSGNALASLLLGVGTGGSTGVSFKPFTSKHYYGVHFQDDWKATRKLTLNLGIRWEYQTAPTERYNQQNYFDLNATNPISTALGSVVKGTVVYNGVGGVGSGLYNPTWKDFAPRLGLAYQAMDKLVVRAGFGLYYVPSFFGQGAGQGYGQSTPWVTTTSDGYTPLNTLDNPFPNGPLPQTGNSTGAMTNVGYSTSGSQVNRPDPYMEQWMAGIQYAVTKNDLIDVSYVANHGVKLAQGGLNFDELPTADLALGNQLLQQVKNPYYGKITSSGCGLSSPTIAYGQLLLPYPEFCSVNIAQPLGSFSHYNALELTYTHRWSSGLNLLASYTYSRFTDNTVGTTSWLGQTPIRDNYNLATEKSLDAADTPHSLVVSYIYELPIGKGKKVGTNFNAVANAVVGGWQVSGITSYKSGFPIAITTGDNNTNSFGGNQRPDLVGNPTLSNPTINEWFNTAAFAQPAPFTFGNAPRYMGNVRAPGLANWDIGLQKWFYLHETLKLQFRAEMFNAFNHANFYKPDGNLTDSTFGVISATLPPRDIQFGLKLYW
ncbi:MAG TPA: carboxypeptidase-like regulatory domain-containing protein [Bryobacteraceae bacterium]|nr:carboxypeptidase-like regulatory domain-containing protein [Bryobacteraceae bacterium]